VKLASSTLFGLFIFAVLPALTLGQESESAAIMAQVKIDSSESKLHLEAWCQNNTFQSDEFHYKFEAIKLGKSGKSNSSQSGKFSLEKGQAKSLAILNLNIITGDSISADLVICSDSVRIAEDHINYKQN